MQHPDKDTYFKDFISGRQSTSNNSWLYTILEKALLELGVPEQLAKTAASAIREEIATATQARDEAVTAIEQLEYLESGDQGNATVDDHGY